MPLGNDPPPPLGFLDPRVVFGPRGSGWRPQMAEPDPPDCHLLWYLEKLSRKECHSLRHLLGQACEELGLPPLPRLELSEETPELASQLAAAYQAQHLWNLVYNIFHKIPRRDLCQTIDARRSRERGRGRTGRCEEDGSLGSSDVSIPLPPTPEGRSSDLDARRRPVVAWVWVWSHLTTLRFYQ